MNASWNFSRTGEGSATWLDHLKDPARPRVAGDGAAAVVRAMAAGLPEATLRLLGSVDSLEDILGTLVHPSNSLIDPTGVRLSPAFTWSRGEVLASMGGMVVPLEELMAEARSEAQAEAVQQFQIAREAFAERRFPETLDAVTRALDTGSSLLVAGRLAWRVHLLRALVLLGSDDNADPGLVDPAEAEQSFLMAARYARNDFRLDAARALLGAGWAAYVKENGALDRRMRAALTYTAEALDLDGDLAEAQFQAAKFRMAQGDADQALHGLRWLPPTGRILLLKAAADGDFQRHSGKLEAFLAGLREEQWQKVRIEVVPIAERIARWMGECAELAATPAARRLVDLAEQAQDRGLLEVHRYFGLGFREDRESLKECFFEVRRTVTREWDEEVEVAVPVDGPDPGGGPGARPREERKTVHRVAEAPEFQFLNGLGEVLITYRGVPGSRKVFDLPPGDGGGPSTVLFPVRWIPPGRFLMGSPIQEPGRETDEVLHSVLLGQGFFLAETPCTQAQWSRIMPENPSRFRGADLPVEQVNWEEAREFARRLTEFHLKAGLIASGWRWDLPTEAQWEYACRVRKPGEFHGPIDSIAWYQNNSLKRTHPVGLKEPNAWGLKDMHGNVAKWCLDWYGPYPAESVSHPAGPAFGTFRVYRGGGWSDSARCCRSAYRGRSVPEFRSSNIGFSLVLSGPGDSDPQEPSR